MTTNKYCNTGPSDYLHGSHCETIHISQTIFFDKLFLLSSEKNTQKKKKKEMC